MAGRGPHLAGRERHDVRAELPGPPHVGPQVVGLVRPGQPEDADLTEPGVAAATRSAHWRNTSADALAVRVRKSIA